MAGKKGILRGIDVFDSQFSNNAGMGIRILGAIDVFFNRNTVSNNRTGIEIKGDVSQVIFRRMNITKNKLEGLDCLV
jgi:parallel beta-helix repeat protein